MKKLSLILLLIFAFNTLLKSQDIILYHNGTEVESKVLKIGKTEIVYKKHSNLNGPEYTEEINNVFMIKYEGGGKDVFNSNEETTIIKESNTEIFLLRSGTNIELYLSNTISSSNLENGDIVGFYVKRGISTPQGKTVIATNTYVEGRVMNSEKAKTGGKKGNLNLMVNFVQASNGQSIPVFLNISNQGEDKQDEAFAVGMFLFWPALFMKGGEAEIEAGNTVLVQTTQDVRFNTNELISGSKNNQNTNIISNTNDNIIYQEIINDQNENPCGEKPKKPINTFNKYQFKLSKEYKLYERKLFEWKDCVGE
jgi:hypothetical protein